MTTAAAGERAQVQSKLLVFVSTISSVKEGFPVSLLK